MALNKVQAILITLVVVCTFFASGLLVLQGIYDQTAPTTGSVDTSFIATTTSNQSLTGTTQTSLVTQSKNLSWMNFDGVNDVIVVYNNSYFNNEINQISISAWILGYDPTNPYRIITKDYGDVEDRQILLNTQTNGQLSFFVTNTSNAFDAWRRTNVSVIDGAWHHVVAIYNGSEPNITFYVDGVEATNQSFTSGSMPSVIRAQNTEKPMFISGRLNSTGGGSFIQGWNGGLDEIRIYNRSLSASDVSEIYANGRFANNSLQTNQLQFYYPFEAGTGTTAYDQIGGNNGI